MVAEEYWPTACFVFFQIWDKKNAQTNLLDCQKSIFTFTFLKDLSQINLKCSFRKVPQILDASKFFQHFFNFTPEISDKLYVFLQCLLLFTLSDECFQQSHCQIKNLLLTGYQKVVCFFSKILDPSKCF